MGNFFEKVTKVKCCSTILNRILQEKRTNSLEISSQDLTKKLELYLALFPSFGRSILKRKKMILQNNSRETEIRNEGRFAWLGNTPKAFLKILR